ncbi:MAG: CHAT domain-containing protein [Rubrivivax sp.]|nr:CHAT domain-containing protein [Rubrivivax sp.]
MASALVIDAADAARSAAEARGWALKDACYAAWHSEPAQASASAAALAELASHHRGGALPALQHWTAGIAALATGQLTAALAALETAQAAFETRGDLLHAAQTQVPQMVALSMLGRDSEAVARGQLALTRFADAGDERSAGKIELNLGSMLFQQHRHLECEQLYRRAAVRFARAGDDEYSIVADIGLANTLSWQLRFDEAFRVNTRARMRAEQRGLGILAAQAEQAIGRLELLRGHWQPALRALLRASARLAADQAPPHRVLDVEGTLADAYVEVQLLAEAAELQGRVARSAQALGAPAEQAWALLQQARALTRLGQLRAAQQGLDQAAALYAEQGNPTAAAYTEVCRAELALADKRPAAGLAHARQAVLGLADDGAGAWAQEAMALEAQALQALGRWDAAQRAFQRLLRESLTPLAVRLRGHIGLGQLAARVDNRDTARGHFEAALEQLEQARRQLTHDESRSALGRLADQATQGLVALALADGEAGRLLVELERGRAQALALGLARSSSSQTFDPQSQRVQWLRDRWRAAVAEGDSAGRSHIGERLQGLEAELAEAQRRVALASGPAPGWQAYRGPTDARELRRALPADTAALLLSLQGNRLVACVVRPDAIMHGIVEQPELAQRVRSLRFQIETPRFGGSQRLQQHAEQLQARSLRQLQALYQAVWAPWAPLLGVARRIVLVPDGPLHYLPWAALHDGQHFLQQRHELVMAPSLGTWLHLQQQPDPSTHRTLVVGAADPALVHVSAEVQAVAQTCRVPPVLLQGPQATAAAVLAAARHADVLHLACHGRFRADNPAFSELRLADGPLTLMDVRDAQLSTRLVVLSACETGQAQHTAGGELQGLVRAFQLAGAHSVLASLWPVDDAATAGLMQQFHAGLARGLRPAAALRHAQRQAAAGGQHPFYWAAFQLHGKA